MPDSHPAPRPARTAQAVVWAFLATASGKLITLAGMAVLARLVAPREFGLVAFALVFLTWAETVGDLGTGMALIYWPDRREDAAQVTFFFNLVMGGAWFGLTWLLAPAVAAFFHNPEGVPILRAIAWAFPLKYLGNTHDALLRKDLRFRTLVLPEAGMAAIKATVSILFARAGYGAWGLVWGHLAGLTAWTALLWLRSSWRPRLALPRDLVRPMLAYGKDIVAVNLLAAVTHRVDLVLVGRMRGDTALGFYQMAYKIPEMSITVLIWVVGRVLFPAFAKLRGDAGKLNQAYLGALRYISLVTLPAAVGLVLLARPLVLTLFGPAWEPSVPILRGLAVYTAIRSLGSHAGDVLKACGRPAELALLGVLKAAMVVPAVWAAARWGGTGTAVAMAMASVVGFNVLLNLAFIRRLTGLGAASLFAAVRASVTGAAVLALWLTVWTRALGDDPGVLRLAGAVGSGALVYAGFLRLTDPGLYRDTMSSLLGRASASRGESPAGAA